MKRILDFETAYRKGAPVAVVIPSGDQLLVLGFRLFENGLGFVEDTYLQEQPSRSSVHFLRGRLVRGEGKLHLADHTFQAVEADSYAARVWRSSLRDQCLQKLHRRTEHLLSVAAADWQATH